MSKKPEAYKNPPTKCFSPAVILVLVENTQKKSKKKQKIFFSIFSSGLLWMLRRFHSPAAKYELHPNWMREGMRCACSRWSARKSKKFFFQIVTRSFIDVKRKEKERNVPSISQCCLCQQHEDVWMG